MSDTSNVESNPFLEFPTEVREAVEGLIWLGHLEYSFEWSGHHFVMRTLKGDEELNAALVSKEYIESLGQAKAWAWAIVGLSLASIDGDAAFCPPLGPNKLEHARARFRYVSERWYWPVGEYLYSQYSKLLERQAEAFRAVQDLSLGSQPTFSPSADSLTDLGTLLSELDLEEPEQS